MVKPHFQIHVSDYKTNFHAVNIPNLFVVQFVNSDYCTYNTLIIRPCNFFCLFRTCIKVDLQVLQVLQSYKADEGLLSLRQVMAVKNA